jgi:hypothetical protein
MQSCWFGVLFFWLFLMAPAFAQEGATFVGAESCAGCHAPETERWKTSHHVYKFLFDLTDGGSWLVDVHASS